MIRVILIHDDALEREGLRSLLEAATGISVVAVADRTQDLRELLRHERPDVLVLDRGATDSARRDIADAIHEQSSFLPVVFLVSASEHVNIEFDPGADSVGYLHRDSAAAEIVTAVRSVHAGSRYACPVFQALLNRRADAPHATADPLVRLTRRERQVLRLLAEGLPNREIAGVLGIGRKTVSTHRMHILAKLGLQNNAELVRFALTHDLLNN